MAWLGRAREWLSETLWVAPALGLVVAMGLAVGTLAIDDGVEVGTSLIVGFGGGADSARAILSTIAASMLTFLALVFTLTVVALQLASDFSPRLLRTFLVARSSKLALALFVATFTYATLVLREVSPSNVPELSVTVATTLAIVSVLAFVYYVSAIAQSLRVANIVATAGATIRGEIGAAFGEPGEAGEEDAERERGWSAIEGDEPTAVICWGQDPGVVTAVDFDGLRKLATHRGVILELLVEAGDFLTGGASLVAVHGNGAEVTDEEVRRLFAIGPERTSHQDAAFGLRQLVDIAARGLSPGINDPTTAVQALSQIHDALLRLGSRRLHSGVLRDADGAVRVLAPVHSWSDFVHLGLDEIRIYGEGSLQVSRRLNALLEDLSRRLPRCRLGPIDEQQRLLDASIESGFAMAADRNRARVGAGAESTT